MRVFRSIWKIYYTFVVTGVAAGTVSYGAVTLAAPQAPIAGFAVVTLPTIIVFCLAVSLPLAGIALFVMTILESRFGPRTRDWWRLAGAACGLALVTVALMSTLSVGALSNMAGKVFWVTFLIAGAVAGALAATNAGPAAASVSDGQ